LFASVPGLDAVANYVEINSFGMSKGLRSAGSGDCCGHCCVVVVLVAGRGKETGEVVLLHMLQQGQCAVVGWWSNGEQGFCIGCWFWFVN